MILPRKIFVVVKDFGDCKAFGGDFVETLDDAIDQAVNNLGDGLRPFRIFQLEFDPDTNRPDRFEEVTDEEILEAFDARGFDPVAA
jgi:hypothetical protein